jgi:hypothetical protein
VSRTKKGEGGIKEVIIKVRSMVVLRGAQEEQNEATEIKVRLVVIFGIERRTTCLSPWSLWDRGRGCQVRVGAIWLVAQMLEDENRNVEGGDC